MNQIKLDNAVSEVKKALKWILISGGLLTFFNGLLLALSSLQSGNLTLHDFLTGEAYALAFMIVNAVIYGVNQYSIPKEK